MSPKQKTPPKVKREPDVTRVSVSFPGDLYKTLEDLAREKKVSMAWVVRDAAEKYVVDQTPSD